MKTLRKFFERLYYRLTIKRFRKAHSLTGQEGLDWIGDQLDEMIKDGYIKVEDGKIIHQK